MDFSLSNLNVDSLYWFQQGYLLANGLLEALRYISVLFWDIMSSNVPDLQRARYWSVSRRTEVHVCKPFQQMCHHPHMHSFTNTFIYLHLSGFDIMVLLFVFVRCVMESV